jgi:hypothetical protein
VPTLRVHVWERESEQLSWGHTNVCHADMGTRAAEDKRWTLLQEASCLHGKAHYSMC